MSYYNDDLVTLHHGDCLDVLREMPDNSVDAVVTDPPYGLGFMGKEWDDLPPGLPFAAECLRVLKPGGHLLAFGGTRTWHRLAVAVEDAGFEVRDSIAWLYGSGFPKSLDVSRAIDKLDAADERRERSLAFTEWMRSTGITARQIDSVTGTFMGGHYLTTREQAAIATADQFDLLRPLLPAVPADIEALVAQRTVESENMKSREVLGIDIRHNEPSGVVNIGQGERTLIERKITAAHTPDAARWAGWGTALKPAFEPIVVGRKPLVGTVAANVLTHGTGALNIDGCRVAMPEGETLNAPQSDPTKREGEVGQAWQATGDAERNQAVQRASIERTLTLGRWPANVVLDDSQAGELDRQSGVSTSGAAGKRGSSGFVDGYDGAYDVPYGDTGGASRFFPTFRYEAKAPTVERPRDGDTAHPTVKPLDLMRWLVRLVTPPGGTVLEPFAGSGTTAEACVIEGFRCIAIEREAAYLPLIVARLSKPIQPDLFGGAA